MSSRREVLIRILALLQRKTLIETKNRTLKCLKRHYSTVRSMKNVAVLTEDGAFALFFRPHPGGFDSSRVPTLGNLPSKAKKMLFPGGQPGEGRLGATGNVWCIIQQEELMVWHPSGVKRTAIRVIGVNFSLFYQGKRYLVRVSGEFELSNEFWVNRVKVTKKWG